MATGNNNDSKDKDACSIQDNKTTAPRATTGKTLYAVETIYSTTQQGIQQTAQPQKKQNIATKEAKKESNM
eukprot:11224594-Ditylum_brightwellii.AAC.1